MKKCAVLILMFTIVLFFSQRLQAAEGEFLPLRLLGTIVEDDSAKSLAVIKNTSSEEQSLVKIGGKVLGFEIAKIMRGKVLLLKEGKSYDLTFPLGNENKEPVTTVSADTRILNRSALSAKIPDLNSALQQAIPVPYIVSGNISGLRITRVKDKALAKKAGIEDGDIVTGINGEKINSIQNALNIYSRLKGEDKVVLEIKRGNQLKNLTYYMN